MSDEMPPSWMWPLEHEIERWFIEVDEKRSEKFGIQKQDDDDDLEDRFNRNVRTDQMMQNEFAAARR
jgi:hypothetical protein